MKKDLYLSHLQENFERVAYGYGISPTTCLLLGEYLVEQLSAAWNNGQLYEKAKQQLPQLKHAL